MATSDNIPFLKISTNAQATLYNSDVQDAYFDALERLSKVQQAAILVVAFDAGVAYGQNLGKPGFFDIMARTNRPIATGETE